MKSLALLTALASFAGTAAAVETESAFARLRAQLQKKTITPADSRALAEVFLAKLDLCQDLRFPEIRDPKFYGSATLIAVGKSQLYYATNAHVVGTDPKQWARLLLNSSLNPCSPADNACRPRVIEVVPGMDLALISSPLPPYTERTEKLKANLRLAEEQIKNILPPKRRTFAADFQAVAALIGFRNHSSAIGSAPGEFHLKNLGADQEARLSTLQVLDARGNPEALSKTLSEFENLELTRFWTSEDCPAPFMRKCLRTRMRSWGFSGGFAVRKNTDSFELIGLMSSYLPLTAETYLIPMTTVLRQFNDRINDIENTDTNQSYPGVLTDISDDGRARWVGPDQISIQNQTYTLSTITMPGGGHNLGGGPDRSFSIWGDLVPGLDHLLYYRSGVGGTRDFQDLFLDRVVPLSPEQLPPTQTISLPLALNAIQVPLPTSFYESRDNDPRAQFRAIPEPWIFSLNAGELLFSENKRVNAQTAPLEIRMRLSTTDRTPGLTRGSGTCRARISQTIEYGMNCHWIWIDSESENRSIVIVFGEVLGQKNPRLFALSADLPPFSRLSSTP